MTELFLRVFNKKEYWKRKVQEMYDIMQGAEFRYKRAVKGHRKRADLSSAYKLARLNFEKAWAEYQKVRGF